MKYESSGLSSYFHFKSSMTKCQLAVNEKVKVGISKISIHYYRITVRFVRGIFFNYFDIKNHGYSPTILKQIKEFIKLCSGTYLSSKDGVCELLPFKSSIFK